MNWTAHKPTSKFGPKRQWYSAEGIQIGEGPKTCTVTITPRRPMVTTAWGKGRKQSKSQIVYDVQIGSHRESKFRTVKSAKEFAEEYVAASSPAERAEVVRAWTI